MLYARAHHSATHCALAKPRLAGIAQRKTGRGAGQSPAVHSRRAAPGSFTPLVQSPPIEPYALDDSQITALIQFFETLDRWDRLIALASIFIAVSLAVFAPEHFGGPMHVSEAVPSWPNFRSLECSVTFLVRLEQVRVAEIARRPFSFQQP